MPDNTIGRLLVQSRQSVSSTLDIPSNEASVDVQALLRHALGDVSRAWLMARGEQALTSAQAEQFQALLRRRLQGEPVAYILGQREFYGLEFTVTPAVLIPRPDTETLVEAALARIPDVAFAASPAPPLPNPLPRGERELLRGQAKPPALRVLDLGTGSGAIAIAIAKHRPHAVVTAVDACADALAVARCNAERLGAENTRFILSDWFGALQGEVFDVIVGNPPYIAAADPHLSLGDLRFEPAGALASGADGLDAIRRIVAEAPQYLAPGGWLLLEHGYDQAQRVAALLNEAGLVEVGHAVDLAGILRVTLGRKG